MNPAAAGGATAARWPALASALRAHSGPFRHAMTKAPGDGAAIAEREARAGARLIVACGGDGTISEVAWDILRSGIDAELGVLPSGTGGDFRRTLGIPARAADAASVLRNGRTWRIDAGRVEYVGHAGTTESRLFVNVASFGLSGVVARQVGEQVAGRLGGTLAYAAAAVRAWRGFAAPLVRLRLDGAAEARLTVMSVCVANGRYFGGGMKIAPTALVDDGRLDVVAIEDLGGLTLLTNAHRVYFGTHLGMRQVQHTRAVRVAAEPAREDDVVPLEVDGDYVGRLPATFEVMPVALRVRGP
ncbi:MAG: diacylglycerol kinase family protein [Gemmatimonadaceae bacterium]